MDSKPILTPDTSGINDDLSEKDCYQEHFAPGGICGL
jgi:hypothetical protein